MQATVTVMRLCGPDAWSLIGSNSLDCVGFKQKGLDACEQPVSTCFFLAATIAFMCRLDAPFDFHKRHHLLQRPQRAAHKYSSTVNQTLPAKAVTKYKTVAITTTDKIV